MADVFISYAREDGALVRELVELLGERGKDVFVDWSGIEPSDRWADSIREAIEGADDIVCVLSPDFLASAVCAEELALAASLNKRLVPVVAQAVDPESVPESLRALNWIFLEPPLEPAADAVVRALETEIDFVRLHTRLLGRARGWDSGGRKVSALLRGDDLRRAEEWLTRSATGLRPAPTDLQLEFVQASRTARRRRQRLTVATSLTVAAVAAALAVFAFISRAEAQRQRDEAVRQSRLALSRQLTAAAVSQRARDPQLALLLGEQAVSRTATPEAKAALVAALDADYVQRIVRAGSDVQAVGFSADGRQAAVGGADGTIRSWATRGTAPVHVIHAGDAAVRALTFDPSGALLADVLADGRIQIWKLASGSLLRTSTTGPSVTAAAFDKSGVLLATASPHAPVAVWQVATGSRLQTIGVKAATSLAFGPNGLIAIASRSSGSTYVWRIGSRQPLQEFKLPLASQRPNAVDFDPAGTLVAMAGQDGATRLWDYNASGEPRLLPGGSTPVESVRFSDDGTLIATGQLDGVVRIWDRGSASVKRVLRGHRDSVDALAFSSDNEGLLTGSNDRTARQWLVSALPTSFRTSLPELTSIAPLAAAVFAPGRDVLIAAEESGGVHAWNIARPTSELWECVRPCAGLKAAPGISVAANGRVVAIPGDQSRVVRTSDGATVATFGVASAVALSPNARLIALERPNGTINIRSLASGASTTTTLRAPAGTRVYSLAFSPDGVLLAGSTDQGSIVLWNRDRGWARRVLNGEGGALHGIAFTPDGMSVVAGGADARAWLWTIGDGSTRTFDGHTGRLTAVAISPDGRLLATASADSTARIWDLATGAALRVIQVDNGAVNGVAFSPDGSVLATVANGGAALWDGCGYCTSASGLLAEARRHTRRCLTALERRGFLGQPARKDLPCAA